MPVDNPFGKPAADENLFELDEFLPETNDRFSVPPGQYVAKVIDVVKTISQSGNKMWVFTFAIMAPKEHAGKEFKQFCVITTTALWKLTETLEALGIGGPGQPVHFHKQDVLNTMVMLVMKDDEYNGQKRSAVVKVLPYPDGIGKKAPTSGVPRISSSDPQADDVPF